MTVNPVTVDVSASLDVVEGLLVELDVRHLPVLEDGVLKGIISDRDLGPWRNQEDAARAAVRAGQIMSSNLFTVHPEADLSEVVDTMLDQKVGALPVVDSSESLVGIISYMDILRVIRNEI